MHKTDPKSKEKSTYRQMGFTKRVLSSPMFFKGSKYPCPRGKRRKNSWCDMFNLSVLKKKESSLKTARRLHVFTRCLVCIYGHIPFLILSLPPGAAEETRRASPSFPVQPRSRRRLQGLSKISYIWVERGEEEWPGLMEDMSSLNPVDLMHWGHSGLVIFKHKTDGK